MGLLQQTLCPVLRWEEGDACPLAMPFSCKDEQKGFFVSSRTPSCIPGAWEGAAL